MSKNNIYTLVIDDNLDGSFREMSKRFKKGEKIISTNIEGKKMLVITEVSEEVNLLLESLRSGKMTQFGKRKN